MSAAPVYMHIGMPKTGTSLLQGLLAANGRALRRAGVATPGPFLLHHRAASELNEIKGPREDAVPQGKWEEVLAQIRAADGPAFFSNERYSRLRRDPADRVVADVAALDRELHVVISVRDLVAAEYSRWQEDIKNGNTLTFYDAAEKAVADREWLRTKQRVRHTFGVWSERLPADRIHIVTVPPSGTPRDVLPGRFAEVVGVDPAVLTKNPPERMNASLDPVGTELVRRLNGMDEGMDVFTQRAEIKLFLGSGGALSRDTTVQAPSPWGAYFDACREESRWLGDFIAEQGFAVHGDLADLEVVERREQAPEPVSEAQVLAKALEAVTLLARRSHERQQQIEQGATAAAEDTGVDRGARMPRRVAQAVRREVLRYRGRS
ncbi:hypothetical protein KLP28_12540 [Nocardioidaceae bacterium]|nr:hypothetical protein KLP28_12540 [Nocardioidaceae bacterium]